MHFITEFELRDSYKKHPFTSFELNSNTRLTPEAKQFLLDRKVNITDRSISDKSPLASKSDLLNILNRGEYVTLALRIAIEDVDITVYKLITCNCAPWVNLSRQAVYDEWFKIKSNLIEGCSEEITSCKSFVVSEFSLTDYIVEGENSELTLILGEFRVKLMQISLTLSRLNEAWVGANINLLVQLINSIEVCIKLISQEI